MESWLRTKDMDMQECSSKECKLPRRHEGLCDYLSPIIILYTNWKGNKRKRKVSPTGQVEYGATEWHKSPCWLFEVIDCDDGKLKKFSIKDVDVTSRSAIQTSIAMRWNSGG